MAQRDVVFWGTALAVVVLDRITKYFVAQKIPLGESVNLGVLSLTHITNTGTAFGLLQNGALFFTLFSIGVVAYIIFKYRALSPSLAPILGLIVGGALGNLIDRLLYGAVLDFIDFHFWPAFNVADSAISIAIILLLIAELRNNKTKRTRV